MGEGLIQCGCSGKPSIWQHKNDAPHGDGFWIECGICCHQTTTHPTDLTAAAAWNIAMGGLLSERVAASERLAKLLNAAQIMLANAEPIAALGVKTAETSTSYKITTVNVGSLLELNSACISLRHAVAMCIAASTGG